MLCLSGIELFLEFKNAISYLFTHICLHFLQAHQIDGVIDCVDDAEKNGTKVRHDALGFDRAGILILHHFPYWARKFKKVQAKKLVKSIKSKKNSVKLRFWRF